ncbi:hypothetical protein V8C86DRAFT_2448737 [Haematococcus lacustris]
MVAADDGPSPTHPHPSSGSRDGEGGADGGSMHGGKQSSESARALPLTHLLGAAAWTEPGAGSRLPLPPTWLITETLQLPDQPRPAAWTHSQGAVQDREQLLAATSNHSQSGMLDRRIPTASPCNPVGLALGLAAGLQVLGSRYFTTCCPAGPAANLQAALQAAYLYDSAELVRAAKDARRGFAPPPRRPKASVSRASSRRARGMGRGAAGALSTVEEAASEEERDDQGEKQEGEDEGDGGGQWRDLWVRWSLAVLTACWGLGWYPGCSSPVSASPAVENQQQQASVQLATSNEGQMQSGEQQEDKCDRPRPTSAPAWRLGPTWCSAALSERLVEQFGALSFGDPLFAAHIAALLMYGVAPALLRSLWSTLGQDFALHLLPRPCACLGQMEQYIGGDDTPLVDPMYAELLVRSVVAGEVDKALAVGSVSAHIASCTIVRFACYGSSASAPADAVRPSRDRRSLALCRSLVQDLTPPVLMQLLTLAHVGGVSKHVSLTALYSACAGDAQLWRKLSAISPPP